MNCQEKRASKYARRSLRKQYFTLANKIMDIEQTVRHISWMQDENKSRTRAALTAAAKNF